MTDSKYVVGQRVECWRAGHGAWASGTVQQDAPAQHGCLVRLDSNGGVYGFGYSEIRPLADINTASMAAVLKECAPYPAAQPAKDWRDAYAPNAAIEVFFTSGKWLVGRVVGKAGDGSLTVNVPTLGHVSYAEHEVRPVPAAAPAPREPRVGDVWRYVDAGRHETDWMIDSVAPRPRGTIIRCPSAEHVVGTGGEPMIGNGSWTLVRAAEDAPQPGPVGGAHAATALGWDGYEPPPRLLCPHCASAELTRAHTVAVYRCRECHWTGSEADRARASEPVRPEPRFRVGDRVCCNWDDAARVCQVMKVVRYDATDRCWVYSVRHEYAGGEAFVALPQETSLTAAERP